MPPITASALALIASLIGFAAGVAATQGSGENALLSRQGQEKLAAAVSQLQAVAIRQLSEEEIVDGALAGITGKLDSYSEYLPASRALPFSDEFRGKYSGIGVEVEKTEGGLAIIAALDGSPAQKAGLLPHDVIVSVDGAQTRGLPFTEVVRQLRGEAGTEVEVGLLREGKLLAPVRLERAYLGYSSVKIARDDDLVYARVSAFHEATAGDLRAKLIVAQAEHPVRGIILDLRGNPGGLLEAGVKLASLFLNEGDLVTEVRTETKVLTRIAAQRADAPGWLRSVSLAVLVDASSASAAELVAGALQAQGRAVVIGTRTYGKGSMQRWVQLKDGSAMKVTQARYYLPDGTSPHERGVLPDIAFRAEVPTTLLASGKEHQADACLPPLPPRLSGQDSLRALAARTIRQGSSAHPPEPVPHKSDRAACPAAVRQAGQ